ncbi:single-stranded DNA-binding protein WHY1, chloroplastic-like, partial [Actinidia eriantha]|uniref:single-stranded DNA-binding protein WHY1, chloroplastic-like n=1 Tax=Actinidia eriantha TaxID=165200 RepID=UPI002587D388
NAATPITSNSNRGSLRNLHQRTKSGAFKLSREGFVALQFAPASGVRHYDWDRKQVFSLSVSEMGSLIKLGARESCEFFHDPSIGKSDEGKVRKLLKVEPLPDGSGHVINLSVQNKIINMEESIYILFIYFCFNNQN